MGQEPGRPTKSLLSVVEAQELLLARFQPLEALLIRTENAAGRVLAQAIEARYSLPPFPNSSMDGFAVRAEDTGAAKLEHPVLLRVVGDIPAGHKTPLSLHTGEAIRIMTGAPLPGGADAVVPVENTDFQNRSPGTPAPELVRIYQPAAVNENIRPVGMDILEGEKILDAGARLRAQELGLLSMLGCAQIMAYRQPRVAIFSSGDELLPVDAPLSNSKIYDANSLMLAAQVQKHGCQAINLGIAPDRSDAVQAKLDQAVAENVDLIVSSAGVSVGAFDFVRSVVEEHGKLDFWRVNMRPGKPVAFGNYQGVPFLGLPGNPVSAFVSFEVFVRPALLHMQGILDWKPRLFKANLSQAIESDGRESYLRAIVHRGDNQLDVRLTGHQGSGNLRSLVQANALLLIPSGVKYAPSGSQVDVWLVDGVEMLDNFIQE